MAERGTVMRDDTRRLALRLLWEQTEGLPLGTRTSVEDLARSCPSITFAEARGYQIAGREYLEDELDIDELETGLWHMADEKGLYVDGLGCGTFALRRRIDEGTVPDARRIERLRLEVCQYCGEDAKVVELSDGWIRLRRPRVPQSLARPVDDGDVAAIEAALRDGGVSSWERRYEPECPVLDGTSWELTIVFDDGRAFDSCGSNAWPAGYDAFERGLLGIFDQAASLACEEGAG